jgi:hypothetical protein
MADKESDRGDVQKKYPTAPKWAAFVAVLLSAVILIGMAYLAGVLVHLIVDAYAAGWDAWRG